ncbi:maleylpyruvate isomerase N-terminal domain-containing protein [Nakamurella lactea]|uniref:maleylpyruvate isomerase N-terminal domain-containing protein n=1 Tax=Nakamurella lactea TaxID=459515 RepID=UPI00041ACEF5|nr:maleylpyruvate isomerase N-terminal domain-containing protein [Nakamurella lactea]
MESTADIVHAAQWGALRAWADGLTAADRRRASVLEGWTVDDLLSHLARTLDSIAALRPVASGELARAAHRAGDGAELGADDTLLTVAGYLGGFAARKQETADNTRKAAASSRADRAGELDAGYAAAQRTLTALGGGDPLVRVRGGIMQLSDFLETRIIELVVHADDLRRSLPERPAPPVLPAAVDRAESTLRAAFLETAGVLGGDTEVARMPAEEFIAVAAGRTPPPDRLPAAVRSEFPLF